MSIAAITSNTPRRRRVVLQTLDGMRNISDVYTDVTPGELKNSFGTFTLLLVKPTYIVYCEAPRMVDRAPEIPE
jgi:hypothetical protein